MIGFFPAPYPDELFYSLLSRYHFRIKSKSLAMTTYDLFGHDASRIPYDLPTKIESLTSRLPSGSLLTTERIIDENTLLPYYSAFLPSERNILLKENMKVKSESGTAHGRTGILTSGITTKFLRFCPLCVEEDKNKYGETYWHRVHQLPGVFVCPHHSVFLEKSSVKCSYHSKKKTLILATEAVFKTEPRCIDSRKNTDKTLLFIAEQADFLLNNRYYNCGPDYCRRRFLLILMRKNLASFSGSVKTKKIEQLFKEKYSKELLELLSSPLNKKFTWIRRLLQASKHFQHPIRNFLFLHFIGYSVKDFLSLADRFYPFGKPPFPCLNTICSDYRKPVINYPELKHKPSVKDRISGIFTCKKCGFIYRRYNYDFDGIRRNEYDYIESYGKYFYEKLSHSYKSGKSVPEISQDFNLSKGRVSTQLKLLKKFDFNSKRVLSRHKTVDVESRKKEYRKIWLDLVKTNSGLSRHKLANLNRRVCQWLSRAD